MTSSSAIRLNNVIKTYGSRVILDGISMHVEKGSIYGLLGASGCGKTTLLSCIVGRKSIDSGEIRIFGVRPGDKGSGIPGGKLGYMPQELALIEEFTISDTLYYFGTIFKMKPDDIENQVQRLSALLDLPSSDRLVKHCSGGQKRRVSFAVALIHSPQILILDEPTVGVDPVLREKIWDHLHDLVATKQTTVIITTHYIEECRNADKIGLMRRAKLLMQESPTKLLEMYQKSTLEEVFFFLSQKQDYLATNNDEEQSKNESISGSLDTIATSTSVESFVMGYGSRDELTTSSEERKTKKEQTVQMSATDLDKDRMRALLIKNWKQFYRSTWAIMFLVAFPIMQLWFFTNSVGLDPRNLNLGIVNNESMTTLCTDFDWNETASYVDHECHFRNLTCRFLTYLEHPMINKVLYDSFPKAIEGVKHGEILGVLYVPTNFSDSFEERLRLGANAQEWTTSYGEIKVYMDMSDKLTGATLAKKVYDLFGHFQGKLFADCNMSEKLGRIPIQENFIYGRDGTPLMIFMTPGMVMLLVYLLGSTMTSQVIIKEKLEGVWDRTIIAGVSSLELTLSHFMLQCVIMLVECAEVMVMIYFLPDVEFAGSYWVLFFLLYFQGVCGMAFGFFVSTVCQNPGDANVLATGGYLPMTLISGVVWPIEAEPKLLRWMSLCSPCTIPILSFRNVMSKGWGLWDLQVLNGFGVLSAWILFFVIGSVWFIKIKR